MIDQLIDKVAALAAISLAAERLVNIAKGFWPTLAEPRRDARQECLRRVQVQVLALGAAAIVGTISAKQVFPGFTWADWSQYWAHLVVLALLTSGGSAFWNSVLGWLNETKNLKQTERATAAIDLQAAAAAPVAASPPAPTPAST